MATVQQLKMDFLLGILKVEREKSLDILKEERQRRKEAEQEVEILRSKLQSLQHKELECIKKICDESHSETNPITAKPREDELVV